MWVFIVSSLSRWTPRSRTSQVWSLWCQYPASDQNQQFSPAFGESRTILVLFWRLWAAVYVMRTTRRHTSAMSSVSVPSTFVSCASSDTPSVMTLLTRWSARWYTVDLHQSISRSASQSADSSPVCFQGGCQACSATSWAGLCSNWCHPGVTALALLPITSDLQVVPIGIQVSSRSDTRLSGLVLCVTVWPCCSFSVACWQFPAFDTAHEHCQVRFMGFLLMWPRFLEHYATSPSLSSISVSGLLPKTSVFCLVEIVATGAFVTIIVNCCVSEMAVYYYCYYC